VDEMAIIQVSVIPIGTRVPSISEYVTDAVRVLKEEMDVKFDLTSMGTIIEGDLEKVLSLAKKMHEAIFSPEVQRVVTTISIDDRRDKPQTMDGKVSSVKEKLMRT